MKTAILLFCLIFSSLYIQGDYYNYIRVLEDEHGFVELEIESVDNQLDTFDYTSTFQNSTHSGSWDGTEYNWTLINWQFKIYLPINVTTLTVRSHSNFGYVFDVSVISGLSVINSTTKLASIGIVFDDEDYQIDLIKDWRVSERRNNAINEFLVFVGFCILVVFAFVVTSITEATRDERKKKGEQN